MKFISVIDVPKPSDPECTSEASWIKDDVVEFNVYFNVIKGFWNGCGDTLHRVVRYRNTILAVIGDSLGDDKHLFDDSRFISITLDVVSQESLSILKVRARGKVAVNR